MGLRYLLIVLLLFGTLRASDDEADDYQLSPTDKSVAQERLKKQHCVVLKELADEIEKCTEGRISSELFIKKFNKGVPKGTWVTGAKVSPDRSLSKGKFFGKPFVVDLSGVITEFPRCIQGAQNLADRLESEFVPAEQTGVDRTPTDDISNIAFRNSTRTLFYTPTLCRFSFESKPFAHGSFYISIDFEVLPSAESLSVPRRTATSSHSYPLWNGEESIAGYADGAKLPPTKTVAVGGGEQIEFVLIPAGEFTMGTPPPPEMQTGAYEKQMLIGATTAVVCALWLVVRCCIMVVQAMMKRQRPTYSLWQWLAFVVIAGAVVISTEQWWFTSRKLESYQAETSAIARRLKYSDEKERPAHKVTITTPFYMSKYPITQEQYFQVTGESGSKFKGKNLPVDRISWNATQNFCRELRKHGPIRLPTEAEWEFACRAGTASAFYTGDNETDLASAGWYSANSGGSTHPVGTKPPNAFGLYDMHGNVRQWCEDVLAPYPDHAVFDPRNPGGGEHVLRGGSWYSTPERCRSTYRSSCNAIGQYDVVGFRVVMDVE